MRLAIMQPYFFPYIGYFSLIEATNLWIVFDTPQFIRKGWINRNRILKKGGGWKYIGINVSKESRETPINKILCHPGYDFRDIILRNLDYYREKNAPYYHETYDLIKKTLSIKEKYLLPYVMNSLCETCNYIGLDFNYEIFSQIDIKLKPVTHAGEWALRISEALGAKTYINLPGGRDIFYREQFKAEGIELKFLVPILSNYDQRSGSFISGLSIIDALMWNSPDQVKNIIKQYKIKE